jgi:hypothetical protein
LDAGPLKDASAWIEEFRRFWTPYVDALERYLDRMDQDLMNSDRMNPDRTNPSTAKKKKTLKKTTARPRPRTR